MLGAITVDDNRVLGPETPFKTDGKVPAQSSEIRLGGGAGNCVQALKKLDEAFGTRTDVKLITRLGRPPKSNLRARLAHLAATEILKDSDIEYIDAVDGESALAFNSVTEHGGGRSIVKDVVGTLHSMSAGMDETIEREVAESDIVFIDPSKVRMGFMAARAANKYNKPCVVDWGQSAWPLEPTRADWTNEIISRADVLMVPSDAVVAGMEDNIEDPEQLFGRLVQDYRIPNVFMSDGSQPVRASLMGQYFEIPVQEWKGQKYSLAAGDTRNAGFLHHLARGHDVLSAGQFGTAVASVKIRYPGLQWADHIKEDIPSQLTFSLDPGDDEKNYIIV